MERFRGQFEIAHNFAKYETLKPKQRQFWMQIYAVTYEESL